MSKEKSNIDLDSSNHLKILPSFKPMVSSCSGAVITSLLMTPLDVVKTRLQSQNRIIHKTDCITFKNTLLMDHTCNCFKVENNILYNRKIPGGRYTGTIDAIVKIVRFEGLASLWSGLPPTLLMVVPNAVLYFTAYDNTKRMFGYHEIKNPNPALPVFAGAIAKILAVTVLSPIELIRTKLQSEKFTNVQIKEALKYSIKKNGLMTLYRGWVSTIWRDVPFSMIYWFNYEKLKSYLIKRKHSSVTLNNYETFLCGGVCAAIAAFLTCPLDVVKTHRQVQLGESEEIINKQSNKTVNIMRQIYKIKGASGLFAGATPRVTKVSCSCAIMITTFEYFKRLIGED